MIVFPAIDLKDGACVRLAQGDFSRATIYEPDPFIQVARFVQDGATWLHLVDLDGARDGCAAQAGLIEKLVRQTKLKVQVGGGVRQRADVARLFAAGASRVVIGSVAVSAPECVLSWVNEFGADRFVLAFDVRISDGTPRLAVNGWQEDNVMTLWQALDRYVPAGLRYVMCTDVSRDGMLDGTNLDLYRRVQQYARHISLIASGGIGALSDLHALRDLKIYGVIVGKALYERRFTLQEAVAEGS